VRHRSLVFVSDRRKRHPHGAWPVDHNLTTMWALHGRATPTGAPGARSVDTGVIRILLRVLPIVSEDSGRAIGRVNSGEQTGTSPENWPNARPVGVASPGRPTDDRTCPPVYASIRQDRRRTLHLRAAIVERHPVLQTACHWRFAGE